MPTNLLITNTSRPIGTKIDPIKLISVVGFIAVCIQTEEQNTTMHVGCCIFMYGDIHNSDNNKICILLAAVVSIRLLQIQLL